VTLHFPDLDAARILYEDEDLIAVDKPEGVPSQSADPAHPDDLVHRLTRFLAARDGATPYVGVHQRLDQDTSGVILYAKQKRANASLAQQFEGRAVEKTYAALVCGWKGGDRRLEHRLVRGSDGLTHVAAKQDRRAKVAVTHVRVRERRGERALIEAAIETGRTHQIRAQLAAVGAPVAGDRLYGDVGAPRLMLHARRIALSHPIHGGPVAIEAPLPPSFVREETLREVVERAIERRWGLAHRADLDAFRLVNEAGDGAPGLAVDAYGDWLVVSLHDELDVDAVLDALSPLRARGVYVKRRPKQANVIVDASEEEYAPSAPLAGEPAADAFAIVEHGVPYLVRLGEGLSTGIFLDQRENRRRVREMAAVCVAAQIARTKPAEESGARVLNLFAYTCAFSVAAARGGATATSVDASGRLLAWGRENFERAGVDPSAHRFVQADAFEELERLAKRGERFELVCVDPPTYSTTKASRWTSGRAWIDLSRAVFRVLAPGGRALACSNDRRMSSTTFRKFLHEGSRRAGVRVAQMKDLPSQPDFPPAFGEEPHMKSVLVTLAG
jgi:23S rRNA (cytosine1962-C5)-methyltransferase